MIELAVLVSILGWGVAGVFAGRASKIDSPISISAWAPFIALPLLVMPIIAGVDYSPNQGLLLASFCSAITLFCAWVLYFFALKEEDASPVVTIGSTYPIFSFIIFVLIGSSQVRISVIVGMLLVVFGLALTQFISRNNGGISKKTLLLSLGSAFSWGIWGFIDYQGLKFGTAFDLMFWTFIFSAFLASILICVLYIKNIPIKIRKETMVNRLATSASSSIALLSFYYALSKTKSPEEIIAVTAAYPIVTMLLAVSLKEEPLYPKRALAIAIVIVGIVVLKI